MIENVKKFEQALQEDKELAKKFADEMRRIVEEKSAGNDAEAIAKAARALGFELTASDLEKAQAESQEIDPEELDLTAGGWCWGSYDCYTAFHHDTPNEEGTDCFKDHDCALAFKHPKCTYAQLLE